MSSLKTNKADSERQLYNLDILHKQMLQMSTVLLEFIKNSVTARHELESEKQQKYKFLLKQQAYLVNWISRLDTQNINQEQLKMPQELRTLHDFSSNLVQRLPEFLNNTVGHRIKQVAAKNSSSRYLSNSIDVLNQTARES